MKISMPVFQLIIIFVIHSTINVMSTTYTDGDAVSFLNGGDSIVSVNGKFGLSMQGDGNLVIYKRNSNTNGAIWSTGTHGNSGSGLSLYAQNDGDLVIYDATGNVKWSSGTCCRSDTYSLGLTDDGYAYMMGRNNIYRWTTSKYAINTNGNGVWDLILDHKDMALGQFNVNGASNGYLANENSLTSNTYSIIGSVDISKYKLPNNAEYAFKLIYYKQDGSEQDEVIWSQTSWITETSVTGYKKSCVLDGDFRGLAHSTHTDYCWIDGEGSSNWWNCVGITTDTYSGGTIPGHKSHTANGQCLYIWNNIQNTDIDIWCNGGQIESSSLCFDSDCSIIGDVGCENAGNQCCLTDFNDATPSCSLSEAPCKLPIDSTLDSYTLIASLMSRDEAELACNAIGYELASVHCQQQIDEIASILATDKSAYIGYKLDTASNDDGTTANSILPIIGSAHWIIEGAGDNYDADKPPECTLDSNRYGIASNSQGNKIGVTCCNNNGVGSRPDCNQNKITYTEAYNFCDGAGLRLCTRDEILSAAGKGQGCSFDYYHVWTSSVCDPVVNHINCVEAESDGSLQGTSCNAKRYAICNNRPTDVIQSCETAAPTPSPTDVSLPTNDHDLFCGAENDKATWAAMLSLDQDTLNLLQGVKNEDAVSSIMEFVFCSEFIYHVVTKAAVPGPVQVIKLTNLLLLELQKIPGIGDVIGNSIDEVSEFIVNLMDELTPNLLGISWRDEWERDGTIFNPFDKLETFGQFLSEKVCDALIGDNLDGLLNTLKDSESITNIITAFNDNINTFLTGDSSLFSTSTKSDLLAVQSDGYKKYKDFSFAVTVGTKLCFSKIMIGCVTRQNAISINLKGDYKIFESRSMFVEFPTLSFGVASSGYVHFDLLSNYLDVINNEISLFVGAFLNIPGSDTISSFMDSWESHSDKLSDIPLIGNTASIGTSFVDGVIEDYGLIFDILTGGASARLSIIYTLNGAINCNGFRIGLSVGDIDAFGGGIFFGYEYRAGDIGNIKQSLDWIYEVDSNSFKQIGDVIISVSKQIVNVFDDVITVVADEIKEIAEDIVDEAQSVCTNVANHFLDGMEELANIGVDGVNGAIGVANDVVDGTEDTINAGIDVANSAFNAGKSAANSIIDQGNVIINAGNSAINSCNNAVDDVVDAFDDANGDINGAKNDCKDVGNRCTGFELCAPWPFDNECTYIGACVKNIVSFNSLCNGLFSPITAPMSGISSALNNIPNIPSINTINRITSSDTIQDITINGRINTIGPVNIGNIAGKQERKNMVNNNNNNNNDTEIIITIPSWLTTIFLIHAIIFIFIGYCFGIIKEKNFMKRKNNIYVNVNTVSSAVDTDTEIE